MKSTRLLLLSISLICFNQITLMAQQTLEGEYYFRRMEMVAGFSFTKDWKFQFFYSYGAVDRNASGTYTIEGDLIKLKSDKEAGKDFTITEQSKKGHGYTLVFDHQNKYLLNHISCIFFTDGKQEEVQTNSDGEVHVELSHCDSIYVQHGLFPDIVTPIKDDKNQNNFFRIALNPSLEQVSFKGVDLTIKNERELTCLPNYFLEINNITFTKSE